MLAWERIDPSRVTTDQFFSLSYSPNTWSVFTCDGRVVANPDEGGPTMPLGFHVPEDWGPPTAIQRGKAGVLFGFNRGEWGGTLLWYAHDGRFREALLADNIVAILPTQDTFVVLAGLSHQGMDRGRAIEVVDSGGAFRTGRSVDLGSAPGATTLQTDGAVLVVTARGLVRLTPDLRVEPLLTTRWGMLYPASVAVDRDETVYVGMRGVVAEVRLSTEPATETWLSPVALDSHHVEDGLSID